MHKSQDTEIQRELESLTLENLQVSDKLGRSAAYSYRTASEASKINGGPVTLRACLFHSHLRQHCLPMSRPSSVSPKLPEKGSLTVARKWSSNISMLSIAHGAPTESETPKKDS